MGVLGVRVRVADPEHDVLVVLSEADGELSLPIVIGPHEGVAIATAQAGVSSPRPGPHDLLLTSLRAAGVGLTSVSITELREGTFIAELVLSNGERVDARASDAIALALRAAVDVYCAEDVLAEAAIVIAHDDDDPDPDDDGALHIEISGGAAQDEDAVAEFREFLDQIDPSDFDDPERP
ncbi:bifunctional nuclease family protein [Pseudactinotalea terrae]|uniref:bifunctional nuclease family protein n=1 Tax=Pseudactinotalea terrae TaxID=1743262 RepID=UPI001F50100E|nr:bifunctional nuclease family protein [Pseudactinotalea terrae]